MPFREINDIERRVQALNEEQPIELRAGESDQEEPKVVGYGIVYGRKTELWPGFTERIKEGAFSGSLAGEREIKSFFNHDAGQVLSTTKSDPALKLVENKTGIRFESPIPPTSYGNDLKVNLNRGNVRGSSFAFTVEEDDWQEDKSGNIHREVIKGTLYEIGPVTNPAYSSSSASLRGLEGAVKEFKEIQEERRKKENESVQADLDIHKKIVETYELLL